GDQRLLARRADHRGIPEVVAPARAAAARAVRDSRRRDGRAPPRNPRVGVDITGDGPARHRDRLARALARDATPLRPGRAALGGADRLGGGARRPGGYGRADSTAQPEGERRGFTADALFSDERRQQILQAVPVAAAFTPAAHITPRQEEGFAGRGGAFGLSLTDHLGESRGGMRSPLERRGPSMRSPHRRDAVLRCCANTPLPIEEDSWPSSS